MPRIFSLDFLADATPTVTEVVTPWAAPSFALLGVIAMGVFAIYNRKKGNQETRAPDVNEIWLQQARDARSLDLERRARRHLEDYAVALLDTFKGYVRRVMHGGDIGLTDEEKKYVNSNPPTIEIDIHPQG